MHEGLRRLALILSQGEISVIAYRTPPLSIHGFSLHLPSTYTYSLQVYLSIHVKESRGFFLSFVLLFTFCNSMY